MYPGGLLGFVVTTSTGITWAVSRHNKTVREPGTCVRSVVRFPVVITRGICQQRSLLYDVSDLTKSLMCVQTRFVWRSTLILSAVESELEVLIFSQMLFPGSSIISGPPQGHWLSYSHNLNRWAILSYKPGNAYLFKVTVFRISWWRRELWVNFNRT